MRRTAKALLVEILGSKCAKCASNDPPFFLDHIIPTALGGLDNTTNIQILCSLCNKSKTARDLAEIYINRSPESKAAILQKQNASRAITWANLSAETKADIYRRIIEKRSQISDLGDRIRRGFAARPPEARRLHGQRIAAGQRERWSRIEMERRRDFMMAMRAKVKSNACPPGCSCRRHSKRKWIQHMSVVVAYAAGHSFYAIADHYGITAGQVRRILKEFSTIHGKTLDSY